MIPDPIDYERIAQRVTQRVQRRYRFFLHSALFVLGIPIVGAWGSPLLFVLWVGAWVGHWLWMSYQNRLEEAIQEEIELERDRLHKRKRAASEADSLPYDASLYAPEEVVRWDADDGDVVRYDN